MTKPEYSKAAEKAYPAPRRADYIDQGGTYYAIACKRVHDSRVAFDRGPKKLKTSQILEAVGIEAICAQVSECETLQSIADGVGVSKGSLIVWLAGYPDQYARAREAQAETLAEDMLKIADDGQNDTYVDADGNTRTDQDVIARSRLRVDARKWLASKMAPKKYGDKLQQEVTGKDGGAIEHTMDVALSPSDAYMKMIGKL